MQRARSHFLDLRKGASARARRLPALVAALPARLGRLSDWPFIVKMGACPAIAMVALVVLAGHGVWHAGGQARLTRAVVSQDLATVEHLSRARALLQQINGRLYRLAALTAARDRGISVAGQTRALHRDTAALATELAAYGEEHAEGAQQAEMRKFVADLRVYDDALDVVGSLLEVDFASATKLIKPFDDYSRRVLASLDGITEQVMQGAEERAQLSASMAGRAVVTVAGVAALTSLVLVAAAFLLARATVRSVRQIAAATGRVASGDQAVDMVPLARRDELGTIVDSLGAFRDNIARVAFLAHHDPLTGLPNRVLFHQTVEQALTHVGRGEQFALLFLDLDYFKAVNDTLGHPVGDALLKEVAERISACVREQDLVARLGGDEFAVIMRDIAEPSDADMLGRRIIEIVSLPYEIAGHQVVIGTSIGISLAPEDGALADKLLKSADTALYRAKADGRGRACFFEAVMDAKLQRRRVLELDLRRAIAESEFELFYQPLVEAQSRQVEGFEALIRWHHRERGLVPPDEFIHTAEATGLIVPIGEWAMGQACRDAMKWPGEISVAVNLSPVQFRDRDLVGKVAAALEASGLPACRLELEITESVLLQDNEATFATLHRLRELGIRISMDDFGTGYSSLSYLRSFPFDKIKIDKSFVRDFPENRESAAIVRAVIDLSNSLHIKVIAEGVEMEEQARNLANEDCTQLQGYLFSRPCPATDIPGLLARLTEVRIEAEPG